MAFLANPGDFPAVRAALDPALTSARLPDAVLASPIYMGEAERYVRRKVVGAGLDPDALTVDQQAAGKVAAIYRLAALVAPVIPIIVREQDRDYSYQRQATDWASLQAQLMERADDALDGLLGAEPEAEAGTAWMFGLANGYRGR